MSIRGTLTARTLLLNHLIDASLVIGLSIAMDNLAPHATLFAAHNNAMVHRTDSGSFLVLVVSAETTIRQTRTLLMEDAGYKVVAAESRHKAIQIAQQFDFDLVILDHTLDKHDRVRCVRFIHQAAPATRILVLHKSGADCGADLCLDSREGPERLMLCVKTLLATQIQKKAKAARAEDLDPSSESS